MSKEPAGNAISLTHWPQHQNFNTMRVGALFMTAPSFRTPEAILSIDVFIKIFGAGVNLRTGSTQRFGIEDKVVPLAAGTNVKIVASGPFEAGAGLPDHVGE